MLPPKPGVRWCGPQELASLPGLCPPSLCREAELSGLCSNGNTTSCIAEYASAQFCIMCIFMCLFSSALSTCNPPTCMASWSHRVGCHQARSSVGLQWLWMLRSSPTSRPHNTFLIKICLEQKSGPAEASDFWLT